MARNFIEINQKEMSEAIATFDKAREAFGDSWLKTTQARRARKHFVPDMKRGSHSARLMKMISVTQAKKWTGGGASVRVGVVKNDADLFPDFSAQALASVLEYGTEERFRKLSKAGIITGRVSTGRVKETSKLREAYEKNKEPFMDDVERSIDKKFEKELR
jgi:7-cyano-7-deazaguanine synthase in queuosine biosynthesis